MIFINYNLVTLPNIIRSDLKTPFPLHTYVFSLLLATPSPIFVKDFQSDLGVSLGIKDLRVKNHPVRIFLHPNCIIIPASSSLDHLI